MTQECSNLKIAGTGKAKQKEIRKVKGSMGAADRRNEKHGFFTSASALS